MARATRLRRGVQVRVKKDATGEFTNWVGRVLYRYDDDDYAVAFPFRHHALIPLGSGKYGAFFGRDELELERVEP